jgi:2-polyprenyl-6-methoxyphenol hydroxylase-like FAD-dependent oxidoreductase
LGGSVELGTALVQNGISQDNDDVTVKLQKVHAGTTTEENARFKYIVGADGAHSEFCFESNQFDSADSHNQGAVRKNLGINFVGETRNESMIYIVDVYAEGFQLENQV